MKQLVFYLIIIGLLSIQACGPSEKEIKQAEYEKQKTINESKFYYPKSYDDWWRFYQPKLKGAQGWVTDECEDSEHSGEKVIVIKESLTHKGWGSYQGQLTVEIVEDMSRITIDFKCFKPDFSVGEWLSGKTRSIDHLVPE
jgi:hypothetical protein